MLTNGTADAVGIAAATIGAIAALPLLAVIIGSMRTAAKARKREQMMDRFWDRL